MAGTPVFKKDFAATIVTGDANRPSLILEMGKGNIDNSTLDQIGKTLVRRAYDRSPEIERIVSDPHLFARVRARINNAAETSTVAVSPFTRVFGLRSAVAACASAAVIAAAVTFSFLSSKEGTFADNTMDIPPQQADVARPLDPHRVNIGELSLSRATTFETPRTEKIAVENKRTRSTKVLPDTEFDSDGEFYPVAYTGDIEEAAAGGRVIRVNMNRSSLFALGVDLPLENDADTVKADLLVGRDGVTRAVRLVH